MECLNNIPKISYADFDSFHDKLKDKRVPGDGSFEITLRCNIRCTHCYVTAPEKQPQEQELTFQEVCRILDQLAEEGCLFLLITGGEPLVRKDFLDIYTYGIKKGLLITLFTNGILVDENIADSLQEWPPYKVEITLYGATRETYESITGIPGSFDSCMRGIRLLLERKIPLALKTMAMTLNYHEVRQMEEIAKDMGVEFRVDPVINPHIDSSKLPLEVRLSPKDAIDISLADPKSFKDWREFGEEHQRPVQSDDLYYCGAGLNSFHIDSYGKLQLCMVARNPSYDLRRGSFREGWYDFMSQVRNQKRTRYSMCVDCDLVAICSTCPGTAEMEHGDKEGPVGYYCELAHVRAEELGLLERHKPHGGCKGGLDSAKQTFAEVEA